MIDRILLMRSNGQKFQAPEEPNSRGNCLLPAVVSASASVGSRVVRWAFAFAFAGARQVNGLVGKKGSLSTQRASSTPQSPARSQSGLESR